MHLLFIEDDPSDIELARAALARSDMTVELVAIPDEVQATDYLAHRGEYKNRGPEIPAVIFLDLKLDSTRGSDLISFIREDEDLHRVPIVMLTSSNDDRDVAECYRLGANAYMAKPIDFPKYAAKFVQAVRFWTEINVMPHTTRG